MAFGPFKAGDEVVGLHVAGGYVSNQTPFRFAAALSGDAHVIDSTTTFRALEQLFGFNNTAGTHEIRLPPNTSVFIPLDLRFERNTWIWVQALTVAAAALDITVGVERSLGQFSSES